MLDKGIPTGGKHCVPLANIFLSYIMRDLLNNDPEFRLTFETHLKLWKRFIDDCGGVKNKFNDFFLTLNRQFNKFDLFLTNEVSEERLQLLDIEIFIADGQFHTKEYRKQTASTSYVKFGSAHPRHCFKGTIKSQLIRLRRLCSRDSDFLDAVALLRERAINSGYPVDLVDNILQQAHTLERNLVSAPKSDESEICSVRWVVLSGTSYESRIEKFASRINQTLRHHKIKLDIVKSTGSSIGQFLFHNNVKSVMSSPCSRRCDVCNNDVRNDNIHVESPTNGRSYPINQNLVCTDCGIYCISCACLSLYIGKTTTQFNQRFKEHFQKSRTSAISEHSRSCSIGNEKRDFSIQYLESIHSRGKYTLSEREYLWNERLRGGAEYSKDFKKLVID